MIIQELTVGMVATCCYVLSKEDRDDCIVIDTQSVCPPMSREELGL